MNLYSLVIGVTVILTLPNLSHIGYAQ